MKLHTLITRLQEGLCLPQIICFILFCLFVSLLTRTFQTAEWILTARVALVSSEIQDKIFKNKIQNSGFFLLNVSHYSKK